jgi:hypothetical protein
MSALAFRLSFSLSLRPAISSFSVFALDRNREREGAALAQSANYADVAAVLFHHLLGNRQAQAHPAKQLPARRRLQMMIRGFDQSTTGYA